MTVHGADGYYKLGARYYDTHGHFTQPDPIVPGGGSYNYTAGDPVNRGDPSGLYWGEDWVEKAKTTAKEGWAAIQHSGPFFEMHMSLNCALAYVSQMGATYSLGAAAFTGGWSLVASGVFYGVSSVSTIRACD